MKKKIVIALTALAGIMFYGAEAYGSPTTPDATQLSEDNGKAATTQLSAGEDAGQAATTQLSAGEDAGQAATTQLGTGEDAGMLATTQPSIISTTTTWIPRYTGKDTERAAADTKVIWEHP